MQWSPDYYTELALGFDPYPFSFEAYYYSKGVWIVGLCQPISQYYNFVIVGSPTLFLAQIQTDYNWIYGDRNMIVGVGYSTMSSIDASTLSNLAIYPNATMILSTMQEPPVPLPVNASKLSYIVYQPNGTYQVSFANGTTFNFVYNKATVTTKTLPAMNPDLVWIADGGKTASQWAPAYNRLEYFNLPAVGLGLYYNGANWIVGNWTIAKWGTTQCAYYGNLILNAA